MDDRPIGIFDSGLGGLTLAAALRQLMPREDLVYFGDSARIPYGAKSPKELLTIAVQDLDFMAGLGVKAIAVACGTLSSNAAHILSAYPIPTLGVLEPGLRAMAAQPGEGPLAIAATQASISSGSFRRRLSQLAPGREILDLACPSFVPLIESGHTGEDDPLLRQAVAQALAPAKERGASALLLGCTHYGIIGRCIEDYLGPEVALVSASQEAAKAVKELVEGLGLTGGHGRTAYYTSGPAEDFRRLASAFLGQDIRAEHVPPMPL